jgi:hypothetical protein
MAQLHGGATQIRDAAIQHNTGTSRLKHTQRKTYRQRPTAVSFAPGERKGNHMA